MVKPPPRLVQPYVPELVLSLSLSAPRQDDVRSSSSSCSASASAGRGAGRATSHQLVRRTPRRDDHDEDDDEDTGLVGTNDSGTAGPRRQRQRQRGLRELRQIALETSASASASALAAAPRNNELSSSSIPTSSTSSSRSAGANDTEKSTSSSPSSPVLSSSNSTTGWAKVTMGSTLVLCHVHAPVPVANLASNHQYYDGSTGGENDDNIMDEGILACHVHLAPHLLTNLSSASSARQYERSLERQLHQALLPSVPLRQYAKCAILLQITVVSSADIMGDVGGGSSMSSSTSSRLLGPVVMAATLALADASVELYDVVTCGRVALVGFNKDDQTINNNGKVEVVVDPDPHEEQRARVVLTVAMMNSWKEVTYWNQQASAPGMDVDPQLVNEAVDCCLEVCKTLHKVAVRHLQQRGPVLPPAVSNRT